MKINKRVGIAVVAGVGVLVLTACHHAGRRHRAEAGHFDHANRYIARELNLDQQQQKELAALLNGFEAQRHSLLNGECLHETFAQELSREKLDAARLQRLASAMIDEMQSASAQWIAQLAAFHETLSNDQKQRLARLIGNRRGYLDRP